jgi:hypothetical protein
MRRIFGEAAPFRPEMICKEHMPRKTLTPDDHP